jgi:hypothetical protein
VSSTATCRAAEPEGASNVNTLTRAVAWPVLTLLVIGGSHLVLEALRPELHDAIVPAAIMPIYLVIGGWTAFGVSRAGGGYLAGLAAAVLLGLMPAMLQVLGFGLLLGRDSATVTTAALFGLAGMTWGGAIGAGIASAIATAAWAPVPDRSTTTEPGREAPEAASASVG